MIDDLEAQANEAARRRRAIEEARAMLERVDNAPNEPVRRYDRDPLERSEPELVKRRERKLDTGAEPDWSGWEIWLAARLKEHDEYLYDVIAEAVQEMIADELRGHS